MLNDMKSEKKEFVIDLWPEVYASRQNKSIMTWPVTGIEEHGSTLCLVVSQARVKGIIPMEESGINVSADANINRSRMMSLIGQEVSFVVTNTERKSNLFVASRELAMEKASRAAWNNIKPNQVKPALVRRIIRRAKLDGTVIDIGLIVEIDGIETFLPVQELSYGWVGDISVLTQPGDTFDVKILDVDKEAQKITISVKALYEDPWPGCADRYALKGIYVGHVTGVVDFGVFVSLEPGVNVLCRHPKSGRLHKNDRVAIVITKLSTEDRKINGVITRVLRHA